MRKSFFLSLTSLCLLMVGLTNCVPSQDINDGSGDPTLSVSKEEIVLPSGGGQEQVIVTTNQPKWGFFSNVSEDWLKITQDADKLNVSISQNPMSDERKATLVISAGGKTQKITVTQTSADMVFSLAEDELLNLPANGGMSMVEVQSNSKSWQLDPIDSQYNWLTVKGGKNSSIMIIEATKNTTTEERVAKLYATMSSGTKKEITVKQAAQAKYLIAFDTPWRNYTEYNLIAFEQERGSVLMHYSFASQDLFGEVTNGQIAFSTSSATMPTVIYESGLRDPKYAQAVLKLMYKDKENKKEIEEYAQFLIKNGFTEVTSKTPEKTRNFVRNNQTGIVIMDFNPAYGDFALVGFVPLYPQEQAYPTFTTLPRGAKGKMYSEIAFKKDKKVADVLAFEKNVGGTEMAREMNENNDKEVSLLAFDTKPTTTEDENLRWYSFYVTDPKNPTPAEYLGSVNEMILFFKNYTLAAYEKPKNSGWDVTDEFYEFLHKQGYAYHSRSEAGTQLYVKRLSPEVLEVLHVTYEHSEKTFDGNPHVRIGYFQQYGKPSNAALNALDSKYPSYEFTATGKGEYTLRPAKAPYTINLLSK